jgi:hypothetical protein
MLLYCTKFENRFPEEVYFKHTSAFPVYNLDASKMAKEPRNMPGVAQRVPGGLGSHISMTFGT